MADSCSKELCTVCGTDCDLIKFTRVRPGVAALIKNKGYSISPEKSICMKDLTKFRYDYITSLIEADKGPSSELEKTVSKSVSNGRFLSIPEDQYTEDPTFGERVSDKLASFGGSWKFIITFSTVLVVWIIINSIELFTKAFDPYPFILLNLVLSCLAAIQAPIIMMSQNRQEAKDRARSQHNYQVNLKAEVEVRQVQERLDDLVEKLERLSIVQDIQLETLDNIEEKVDENKS